MTALEDGKSWLIDDIDTGGCWELSVASALIDSNNRCQANSIASSSQTKKSDGIDVAIIWPPSRNEGRRHNDLSLTPQDYIYLTTPVPWYRMTSRTKYNQMTHYSSTDPASASELHNKPQHHFYPPSISKIVR